MQIDELVKKYAKKYGENVIFIVGDERIQKTDVIPTGSFLLDNALGVGGIPRGAFTEIFGQPGSGKTTLALHAVKEAQKLGLNALYVDFEHALDLRYVKSLGIDLHRMPLIQPKSGEDGLRIAEEFINNYDDLGLVVIDSVAAISTKQEIDGDIGDSHIGLVPRFIGKVNRKLAPVLLRKNIGWVYINQLRANIGAYAGGDITPGGKSIPYYAKVRIKLGSSKLPPKNGAVPGITVRADVVKNKLYAPYKRAEFRILFGLGIDRSYEIVNAAEQLGIIVKKGSWYANPETGETMGQGFEKVYEEFGEILESQVKESLTHISTDIDEIDFEEYDV